MILEMDERAEQRVDTGPEQITERGRLKIFLGMAPESARPIGCWRRVAPKQSPVGTW